MYVKFFVVDAAICEPMSQRGLPAVVAGAVSQPRLEERDRASQITARLIRNGQAHRAMRVEFPARFFNRLARTRYQANRVDDPFGTNLRCAPVTSRHRGHAW